MQHSNSYTLFYAFAFTAIVAVVLAVAATGLRPRQKANEDQAKRSAILESVMEVNRETLEADYNNFITEVVVDAQGNVVDNVRAFDLDVVKESKKPTTERRLPIFIFSKDERTNYILPLQGKGLWGPINAFLALEKDLNTVYGVVFDHRGETPGLGAEINTTAFESRYKDKKLFDDAGSFASIRVLKGSGNLVDSPHEVDGLSGATMTINGVTKMFKDELTNYIPYLQKTNS